MSGTISEMMWYGDEIIFPEFPERTRIIRPHPSLPVLDNLEQRVLDAINNPINHEPMHKLAGPSSKVTIAFDDISYPYPPMKKPDARQLIISILLKELYKKGVKKNNITLICANGLHRKWTRRELGTILGKDLIAEFGPGQLFCHDAEDRENLVYLGLTENGYEVEVNRLLMESDLFIYVNITWAPMNGGWKSTAVGLGTYRSIRHHHNPEVGSKGVSQMDPARSSKHARIREQGEHIARELAKKGRKVFQIETALCNTMPYQLTTVLAGHPPEVHKETLKVVEDQYVIPVQGQTDVAIFGCPNTDPYSQLSVINPILVANLGLGYMFGLYQNKPLCREGGIVICVSPCLNRFDDVRHPSYREFFEKVLSISQDPVELWDLYAEDFAHRPEYIHKYRYGYAFHGVHPLILWGNTVTFPRQYLSRIFFAGVKDPEAVERMGFEAFPTLEDAIREAENQLGKDCSITYHPVPPLSVVRVE